MMARLRVILPPGWVIVAFVAAYLTFEAPVLYFEWKLNARLEVERPGTHAIRLGAFALGVWRVAGFHPAYRPRYRAWLELTPWSVRKPMPGGPIAVGWEDLLPLGSLCLISAQQGLLGPLKTLIVFLIGYLSTLAIPMWMTGAGAFGYAIAFGIGLIVRLWPDPIICLAASIAIYGIARVGIRASMAKFPWPDFPEFEANPTIIKTLESDCGWPFDLLRPDFVCRPKLSRADGVMIGLLAGWFVFAAESLLTIPADRLILVQVSFLMAVTFSVVGRTGMYYRNHAPPISLWGRIRTFRWIIPGYDQIFVAPICIGLIGVLASKWLRPRVFDELIFYPAMLAVAIAVALTAGPSLTRWRMTGKHRIFWSMANKAGQFIKVG